jgi:hypothetical protein
MHWWCSDHRSWVQQAIFERAAALVTADYSSEDKGDESRADDSTG